MGAPQYPHQLSAAISQLGIQEATGNNDGVPADRYMRGDKLAWCAGFILWCFDAAGRSLYRTSKQYYGLRLVQSMEDEMKRRGVWFGFALLRFALPGDVVFFGDRGDSDKGAGRHVAMVEWVDFSGVVPVIHTIEGNTSDAVRRRKYKATSKRITGFARPL